MIGYKLDDQHNVVPCSDEELVALFDEDGHAKRRVALDKIGGITVSTVFLCFDHGLPVPTISKRLPLVFETMVFDPIGSDIDQYQEQYSTWDEAVAGHARILRMVKESLFNPFSRIDL